MVQDKEAVLRILKDLYQARALDLRAKFIICTKLDEPEQVLAFLRVSIVRLELHGLWT